MDVLTCLAAGFDDHLTKPINFQKLEQIILGLMQDGRENAGAASE